MISGLNLSNLSHNSARRNPDHGNLYTWVSTYGNDTTGDGTFNNPYKTLMKAESLTLTGTKSTIYVKTGTYDEGFAFSKAYTWKAYGAVTLKRGSNAYIVTLGTGDAAIVIDGFTIDKENRTTGALTFTAGGNNKTISNCTFVNSNASYNYIVMADNSNSVITGCTFSTGASRAISCGTSVNTNLTISNCTFNGVYSVGTISFAHASYVDSVTITGCTFNFSGGAGIYIDKSADITITNCTVNYVANVTALPFLYIKSTSTVTGTITITNCNFLSGSYAYCTTTSSGGILDFQGATNTYEITIDGCTFTGTYATLTTAPIRYDNQAGFTFTDNYMEFINSSSLANLLSVTQSSKDNTGNIIIDRNTFKGICTSYIIRVGTDSSSAGNDNIIGAKVRDNLIYANRYYNRSYTSIIHAILIGFCIDYECSYNTILGAGYAIVLKHNNSSTMTEGGCFYNTIVDAVNAIHIKGINGLLAYNNTILNFLTNVSDCIVLVSNPDHVGAMSGVDLKNNIIYAVRSNSRYLIAADLDVTFTSDYNVLYTDNPNYICKTNAGKTLSQWRALGYDVNSLNEAPELENLTDMDVYNPRPIVDSNVIGIGENLGTDYDDAIDIVSVPPSITTKTQPESPTEWTIGSYIRAIIIPICFLCSMVTANSFRVNWFPCDTAPTVYEVSVSDGKKSRTKISEDGYSRYVDIDWTTGTLPIEPDTTYLVKVRAYYLDVPTEWSNTIAVTTLPEA